MLSQLDTSRQPTTRAQAGSSSSEEAAYTITLQLGSQSRIMNYGEAFVFAHDLLRRSKFGPAGAVFNRLSQVPSKEPRANILLALCEAGLSQYSAAFKALNDATFSDALLAADIYDAIVESRMGFKGDAIQKLLMLAGAHTELPTLCLWLGDMYDITGHIDEALRWHHFAIARDAPLGAVALAARRQIERLKKTSPRRLVPVMAENIAATERAVLPAARTATSLDDAVNT